MSPSSMASLRTFSDLTPKTGDAIEKAYHKGFFLEIIEKNFEKIMSAQGVDPNKLQVELDALREDF